MATTVFPPPPTYAEPTLVDPRTGKAQFNPIWLKWFVDVAQILNALGAASGNVFHNSLSGLQGGIAGQFYHVSQAQDTYLATLATITGISVTITTGPLSGIGTTGSMTFVNGLLTAQTPAT